MDRKTHLMCPSAEPDGAGATLFGVVLGTPERPETAYLEEARPVTAELLALADPVAPTEMFRFAARCIRTGCAHYDDARDTCRFGEKTVRLAPVVVHQLPRCAIRSSCRWWYQEGAAACQRCPQVVRTCAAGSTEVGRAADPRVA
ncbi:MAG: nitrogen fixation protein [Betaproteobacteria bacterium]|nr:MAG: nitrogen fixation protein [Betaproteobacteria bacterium]